VTVRRRSAHVAGAAGAAVLLIAAGAALQRVREAWYPPVAVADDSLYITSGPVVRRLAVGYNALAADLYWIRAIQYYGGTKLRLGAAASQNAPGFQDQEVVNAYPSLYPMLDLTTTLDPRFNIAYRFGAIFLAEPYPGGAGRPDLAIALLEKGLRERADKWEYMQDAGFVHYWWRQDYKAAADWFDRASKVPGAPWWLRSLAANTLAEGGDRRSSRLMWETIRQSAEVEWLRNDAERRLSQLQALDQIDNLQPAVDLAASRGVSPLEWSTLIRSGVLPGVPVDPSGTPYELGSDGRVRLSPKSTLFPPPREPQRLLPLS
jgi:hypothetical protein